MFSKPQRTPAKWSKTVSFIAFLLVLTAGKTTALPAPESYSLKSPDGNLEIVVTLKGPDTSPQLHWSLFCQGEAVLSPSPLGLLLENGERLGYSAEIETSSLQRISTQIPSPYYKKAQIQDNYTQLTLHCKGGWGLSFRAYDEGVAYRFFSSREGELIVYDEIADFRFPQDFPTVLAYNRPRADDRFASAYQSIYTHSPLSGVDSSQLVLLPALVTLPQGRRLVITEADLEHYPGMFLQKSAQGLNAVFPPYPKDVDHHPTRKQQRVVSYENFLARTEGTRQFPWRVFALSQTDGDLLNSDLVYKLAAAPQPELYPAPEDPEGWIRPGKVAWDWWNDWRIYGVDFVAGINTPTYKYYIDFASAYGLEYVILDEGWSPPARGDVMQVIPEIDLPGLVAYAKERNVELILWVVWNVLDEKMEQAFAHYAQMGIRGFKIDFIDRADQKAIEFVSRSLLTAAKHKLILDFHGVSKPTGQQRTYPNALNFEGVYGLEELKWSNPDMPLYDVTYPFIRGLAGPADYTQGAMKNAARDAFSINYREPGSQGTRCHQLGSYMIFDAPLAMLCDNPSNYMREPEYTQFLAGIPTSFDETVVVTAELGEYIVMARRKGTEWYIGGLTNWTPRELELDLSFLPQGAYTMDLFTDGVNAHRVGIDYKRETRPLDGRKLKVKMASGGGFALKLK
jgi:Glycoside hydrolase 97.